VYGETLAGSSPAGNLGATVILDSGHQGLGLNHAEL